MKSTTFFHRSRRMFVILNDKLFIAPENYSFSHRKWLEREGLSKEGDTELIKTVTRGFVDSEGIYFYKGADFGFDEESEALVLKHLKELVEKLKISQKTHLFGGMVKGKMGDKWPPKKDFGAIKALLG